MSARCFVASLIVTLLFAVQAFAYAAGDMQKQSQIPTAHTLQSAPVKLPAAAVTPAAHPAGKAPPEPAAPGVSYKLVDKLGRSIKPSSVAVVGNDLYFLGPEELWCAAVPLLTAKRQSPILICAPLVPAARKVNGIPLQEFCDLVVLQQRKTLIVLEKSGDLLEFDPASCAWRIAWPNKPITYSPDPDFIGLAALPDAVVLLDPERNELWKFDGRNMTRLITPEVLPWKTRQSKSNLADGLAVCADCADVFALKRSGTITQYGGKHNLRPVRQLSCKACGWLRPARICSVPVSLLMVDREHNALAELDKHSNRVRVQSFSSGSDLRGLCAVPSGFCVINGDNLVFLPPSWPASLPKNAYTSRTLDLRLQQLRLPINHSRLPHHPGVWPGARRLYRYGVHQGVDFFYDTGCGITIKNGTPVCAAGDGKIIRIDGNFKDLNEKQYAQIMKECVRNHNTSEKNEDLLRGCQVWIDHGNGLVTKYAHLDHVNHKLHQGDWVKRGSVIGYVGVSGTGENLPGRVKQPHLHFEVWLDGNYLGYGLTPAETIAVFEKIFGCGC